MRNAGLEEAQAGIKIAGRNINNLRYADDTTLMAESEEELKSLLIKVKEESEKVGLKLNIQKMKIMASGPTTSWQIDGEKVEAMTDFTFLGSKITVDGDCSHEIKKQNKTNKTRLFLGRKALTNLDSILKSRDIALPTKEKFMSAIVCIRRQWNSIFIVLRESIFELGFLCPNYFYGILHRHNNPNSPPLRQTKIRLLLERKQIGSIL